jgi:sec-independent protein translocase protein TatA
MPFNLGPMEMVFVMVVLLMVFGGKRLPELGSGLGKGIREFKRSMSDITSELQAPVERVLPPQQQVPGQVTAGLSSSVPVAPAAPAVSAQPAATSATPPDVVAGPAPTESTPAA